MCSREWNKKIKWRIRICIDRVFFKLQYRTSGATRHQWAHVPFHLAACEDVSMHTRAMHLSVARWLVKGARHFVPELRRQKVVIVQSARAGNHCVLPRSITYLIVLICLTISFPYLPSCLSTSIPIYLSLVYPFIYVSAGYQSITHDTQRSIDK